MSGAQSHIIIASVHRHQYSETFIRDHVNGVPYQVHYFYGGYLPSFIEGRGLLPHWLSPIYPLLAPLVQKGLVNYIKSQKIALVLAEYGPVGAHLLPVCKAAGVPLLVYFHGYDATRAAVVNKYAEEYKELFAGANGYFSVSHALTERLLKLGADAGKIVYNPCGAALERFPFSDVTHSEPVLLSVGRFADTKNPQATIRAFARVLDELPEARLRMAGAGAELEACQNLVKKLDITDSVDFLGVLTSEEVYAEMTTARAFVQHSVTTANGETEGSPVAIMEAGAAGLPVIATRHGGIKDIVQEGETGILVDEYDEEAMAQAMIRLLTDAELAARMGKAARQRVEQHFSLERNIRILTETIEKHL